MLGVEQPVVAVSVLGIVRQVDAVKAVTYVAAQVLGLWRSLHVMHSRALRLLFVMALYGAARLFDFAPELDLALSLSFCALTALVVVTRSLAFGVLRLLVPVVAASRATGAMQGPGFEIVLVVVRLRAFGVLLLLGVTWDFAVARPIRDVFSSALL